MFSESKYENANYAKHGIFSANNMKMPTMLSMTFSLLINMKMPTMLSMTFSLLIDMKMPTIVGIFIFIGREIFMLSYVWQERIGNC